jgi:hypothetical protein
MREIGDVPRRLSDNEWPLFKAFVIEAGPLRGRPTLTTGACWTRSSGFRADRYAVA